MSNISLSGTTLSIVNNAVGAPNGQWTFQTKNLFTQLTDWMTSKVITEINQNEAKINTIDGIVDDILADTEDILADTEKGGH